MLMNWLYPCRIPKYYNLDTHAPLSRPWPSASRPASPAGCGSDGPSAGGWAPRSAKGSGVSGRLVKIELLMEVSVDSLLENPSGMDVVRYIRQHSERVLPSLLQYVVSEPDILLRNERQCYL